MRKVMLGILLASSSMAVMASDDGAQGNWVGGIAYSNLSNGDGDLKLSLGALIGSLGYKFQSSGSFHIMPEVRIGFGITDDTVSFFEVELDSFMAFSVRGQFDLDSGVYLFAAPTYANAKFTESVSQVDLSYSTTFDSWEFGLGLGAGYNFNPSTSAEVSYEQFDGTDVITFGAKFNF